MEIDIELEFENLPLSVKAQACTGFIGCVTAMDNTDACCGSGVTLTTKMTLDCSPNTPHLQNPKATELSLSPIKVDISFAGIHITSKDVTSDAEKMIKQEVEKLLNGDVSKQLNDAVNAMNPSGKVVCTQSQVPTTTTTTTSSTSTSSSSPDSASSTSSPPNKDDDGSSRNTASQLLLSVIVSLITPAVILYLH